MSARDVDFSRGHHTVERGAGLGAVKAASLRSAAAFRAASNLDRACAQRNIAVTVMAKKPTFDLPDLVDAFVRKINSDPREPASVDEVPEYLRETAAGDSASRPIDGWTNWRVVRRDNSTHIEQLQERTGMPFPPSFQYLLANYSFPAFEFGPIMFFANTGEDTFWELGKRLFQDPHMSPHLLRAGLLQIGNPYFYNYDPVCFDDNSPRIEKRIVQLDHEEILQRGAMKIVKEIAPSFIDLVDAALR